MNTRAQLRQRILDALELEVKQFRTREALYPLRTPLEPLAIDRVLRKALGEERHRLDPDSLRTRTLLHLEWEDGSAWDLWAVTLPSGLKLFCDSGEEGSRILASGGRNAGVASERLFLELLGESGGEHFGIEWSGDAPVRVRSAVEDRDLLVDLFTNLFEGAGAQTSVAAAGGDREAGVPPGITDFRDTVARWLSQVLDGSPKA